MRGSNRAAPVTAAAAAAAVGATAPRSGVQRLRSGTRLVKRVAHRRSRPIETMRTHEQAHTTFAWSVALCGPICARTTGRDVALSDKVMELSDRGLVAQGVLAGVGGCMAGKWPIYSLEVSQSNTASVGLATGRGSASGHWDECEWSVPLVSGIWGPRDLSLIHI